MRKHAFQHSQAQLLLITLDFEPIRFERPRVEPPAPAYVDRTEYHDFSSETGEFMTADDSMEDVYKSLREGFFK